MKKKILIFIGVAAIVGAVAVNLSVKLNNNAMSDLTLANIEALARGEDEEPCSGTCGWHGSGLFFAYCGICKELALEYFYAFGGNWCCDSCPDAEYC